MYSPTVVSGRMFYAPHKSKAPKNCAPLCEQCHVAKNKIVKTELSLPDPSCSEREDKWLYIQRMKCVVWRTHYPLDRGIRFS